MKKSVLFLAMIAAAMASCSKDEISELNIGEPISFRPSVETRALLLENMTQFTVGAAFFGADNQLLMRDVTFTKEDGASAYTSPAAPYWPADGSDVTFYTYAGASFGNESYSCSGTLSFTPTEHKLYNFDQPSGTNTFHYDFIYATATANKDTGASGVALNFKHPLAQIEVQAMKNGHPEYYFKVRGIRICNVGRVATFDFDTETWSDCTKPQSTYEHVYNVTDQQAAMVPFILGTTYRSIMDRFTIETPGQMGDNGQGNMYLIPQTPTPWDPAADKTNVNQGAYIAIYAQISTGYTDTFPGSPFAVPEGSRLFPSLGVEDHYGWIAVPFPADTKWEPGMKYIYKIDFSSGFGYVDPGKTDPADPAVDPFAPGDLIMDECATVTVKAETVSGWSESNPGTGEELPM